MSPVTAEPALNKVSSTLFVERSLLTPVSATGLWVGGGDGVRWGPPTEQDWCSSHPPNLPVSFFFHRIYLCVPHLSPTWVHLLVGPEWSSAVPCVLYPTWGSTLGSRCLLGQALKVYRRSLGNHACPTHCRMAHVLIGGAGGSVLVGFFGPLPTWEFHGGRGWSQTSPPLGWVNESV